MRTIENGNSRSRYQKAVRGAQIVKGAVKAGSGIASGNFVAVAQGVSEALSPKVIAVILAVVIFLILLPVIIIAAVPQVLFSWGTVNDAELIARNQHGSALVQCYEKTIANQEEGVSHHIYWLISIESVRSKQKLEDISEMDVKSLLKTALQSWRNGIILRAGIL